MPHSFYEGDLHVLKQERELRKKAHEKLDRLEKNLEDIQQKVKDARERFSPCDKQQPPSNSPSGIGNQCPNAENSNSP